MNTFPTSAEPRELYEQICAARDDLERALNHFLRRCGWKYTCSTPGSCWLWEKALPDGRLVLVSTSQAVTIEEALQPPLLDDDDDDENKIPV